MTPSSTHDTATPITLDELRRRHANTRQALANRIAEREKESDAVAATVAETGAAPADWPTRSTLLDSDIRSFQLGLAKLDQDTAAALAAHRLAVGKLQGKRTPIVHTLDTLYTVRLALVTDAVASARAREPMPSEFAVRLATIESDLVDATAQLAQIDADIATASEPLDRHEREQRAAA